MERTIFITMLKFKRIGKKLLNILNLNYSDMDPFADHCFVKTVNQKKFGLEVNQVKNMYFQLDFIDME